MPFIQTGEIFIAKKFFTELGGFNATDFIKFTERWKIQSTEDGYPIFEIMSCLNKERKKRQWGVKTEEVEDLEKEEKHEKVQKLRIMNQRELGILIPRERVRVRVLTFLNAFASKMRYSIKSSAVQVAGLNDAMQVEKILTEKYNENIDALQSEAKIMSWSEDGINSELGRTGSTSNSGEDIGDGGIEEDTITLEE